MGADHKGPWEYDYDLVCVDSILWNTAFLGSLRGTAAAVGRDVTHAENLASVNAVVANAVAIANAAVRARHPESRRG